MNEERKRENGGQLGRIGLDIAPAQCDVLYWTDGRTYGPYVGPNTHKLHVVDSTQCDVLYWTDGQTYGPYVGPDTHKLHVVDSSCFLSRVEL